MTARAGGRRGARWATLGGCVVALMSCGDGPPQALGTLEYDRVTLPAPARERIVAIEVREGEEVVAGQPLVRLDARRTLASTRAAQAEARRQRETLAELEAGPREEDIARARAELAAAEAQAQESRTYLARIEQLAQRGAIAAADVDRARAAAGTAGAEVRARRAALLELERGTRAERLAQGEAAERAASAEATRAEVTLDELSVVAPRRGRIDSLPFELGDEPPAGAPLAVMLVGDAPYARVYVPEPIRASVHVGQRARVFVDGVEGPLEGRVRMISSEPSFTPYYALIGEDAARLSYLAEVALTGERAAELPAGLPVRVELGEEEAT